MDDAGFREYINGSRWKFAKTMASIPHEYTVKDWAPERLPLFNEAVMFIREHGYKGKFFSKTYLYYDVDEHQYWTMGNSLEITKLINRAVRK
jgi:hypothetical protein